MTSLHYYIYALGGVNRHFNFIRLFQTPNPKTLNLHLAKEDYAILLNILELTVDLTFRSSPDNLYNQFSRTPMSPERRYMHLMFSIPSRRGMRNLNTQDDGL